jgi:chitin synthase
MLRTAKERPMCLVSIIDIAIKDSSLLFIDSVPEFVSQRRRWLNGAFFAAVYSLVHFRQIWRTDHSVYRKILLHIEFVYQFVNLLFTYFSLANFYLTFYFVAGSLSDPTVDPFGHSIGLYIFAILRYTCVLLICTQFILSMGNRPQGAKKLYMASMIIYSIIMAYNTFATIYIVVRQLKDPTASIQLGNNVFTNLIVSTAATVGLYFFMSFFYLDPWHMFTSALQYFLLLPSYICTLQVYAFCNTHDITWGTKGDNVINTDLGAAVGGAKGSTVELEMPSEQLDIDSGYDEALRNLRDRLEVAAPTVSENTQQEDYYRAVRTYMVVTWMVCNAILAMAVSESYAGTGVGDNFYLKFILWSVASVAFFRALGSGAFRVINVVNAIVDGRHKFRLAVPEWLGGIGEKLSDKVSSIGSSVK